MTIGRVRSPERPAAHGAPVRLGVLGCADVARRRVLPAVAGAPGIELVAVASRDRDRAEAFTAEVGGEPVLGYESLLRRPDVDAVYVPLPSGLHAEWIERALLAGKHVLAEKPLSTSLADTTRLVGLARERGLALVENFMFVHHAQHAAVRALLDAGVIGELHGFSATFAIPARPDGDIRLRTELGGGSLLDTAGYPVRAALLFLGPGLSVLGARLRHDEQTGVDLGGAALLGSDPGVHVQVSFGLDHGYLSRYEFHGSTGRLALEHVFTTPAGHRPVARVIDRDGAQEHPLPADDQYLASIAAFTRVVREGGQMDATTTVAQAALIDDVRHKALDHRFQGHDSPECHGGSTVWTTRRTGSSN